MQSHWGRLNLEIILWFGLMAVKIYDQSSACVGVQMGAGGRGLPCPAGSTHEDLACILQVCITICFPREVRSGILKEGNVMGPIPQRAPTPPSFLFLIK